VSTYAEFLQSKRRVWAGDGLGTETTLPSSLFPWQAAIVKWALRKGRAAIFADCGLGKTLMQLAWAQAIPGRVLILAPLCVAEQTVSEGARFGITVRYARHQDEALGDIVITNYERVDGFDPSAFDGVVLDESSILKAFDGKTRSKLIALFAGTQYRLCCTATPSPNDIAELANHAEFIGLMTRAEFLATWFVHDDEGWRMKKHAVEPFYRWLASWALSIRKPSDIGYSDDGFVLPPLRIHEHVVDSPSNGVSLFPELGIKGIAGRSVARKGSMVARLDAAIALASASSDQFLLWCGLNDEADTLANKIDGAINVQGSDSYAVKTHEIKAFLSGATRVLITKIKVAGFGLNFQQCHNMAFVGIGDSYEQYYQAIRRCWRFGQQHPVNAHIIVSDAERAIVSNVKQKEAKSDQLAADLLAHMRDFEREELSL
jgi:superfamily II DNA or RNA helicase